MKKLSNITKLDNLYTASNNWTNNTSSNTQINGLTQNNIKCEFETITIGKITLTSEELEICLTHLLKITKYSVPEEFL